MKKFNKQTPLLYLLLFLSFINVTALAQKDKKDTVDGNTVLNFCGTPDDPES